MTFPIKQDFVGLAIGSRGSNISAARDLPGVSSIELSPKADDPATYEVIIQGTVSCSWKANCIRVCQ